jgi:hypothetical protein
VPLDVVRVVAAYAPAAFVRVSRGPWACAGLVDEAFVAWATHAFVPGFVRRAVDERPAWVYWPGIRHYCGRWTRFWGGRPSTGSRAGRVFVRGWCGDVVGMLPREYVRERSVLQRLYECV